MNDLKITDKGKEDIYNKNINFARASTSNNTVCKIKSIIDYSSFGCVVSLLVHDFNKTSNISGLNFYNQNNDLVFFCDKNHSVNNKTVIEFNFKINLAIKNKPFVINDKTAISKSTSNEIKINNLDQENNEIKEELQNKTSKLNQNISTNASSIQELMQEIRGLKNHVENQDKKISVLSVPPVLGHAFFYIEPGKYCTLNENQTIDYRSKNRKYLRRYKKNIYVVSSCTKKINFEDSRDYYVCLLLRHENGEII